MRDGLPAHTLHLLLAIYWWSSVIVLGIKTSDEKKPSNFLFWEYTLRTVWFDSEKLFLKNVFFV